MSQVVTMSFVISSRWWVLFLQLALFWTTGISIQCRHCYCMYSVTDSRQQSEKAAVSVNRPVSRRPSVLANVVVECFTASSAVFCLHHNITVTMTTAAAAAASSLQQRHMTVRAVFTTTTYLGIRTQSLEPLKVTPLTLASCNAFSRDSGDVKRTKLNTQTQTDRRITQLWSTHPPLQWITHRHRRTNESHNRDPPPSHPPMKQNVFILLTF